MNVECLACSALVAGVSVASFSRWDDDEHVKYRYEFLRCPECGEPLLVAQMEIGPDEWDTPHRLYPSPPVTADPSWPASARSAYLEAENCFQRAKAFNATAVMCRRALEFVCAECGVTSHPLARALQDMKSGGLIDDRLLDWAQALRAIGNVGAHANQDAVSPEDARDVLEFSRAVMDYVFTYQKRFEAFKARRAPKTKP